MTLKTLWNKISEIGLSDTDTSSDESKKIMITNRVALVLAATTLVIFLIDAPYNYYFNPEVNWLNTARSLFISISIGFVFIFNFLQKHTLAKLTTIISPILFVNFFPILVDKVNAEILLISPLTTLGITFFIHLIFHYRTEKIPYWLSMLFGLIMFLFTEKILYYCTDYKDPMFSIISKYSFIYIIIKLSVYTFINAILFYTWRLNFNIQERLEQTKSDLIEKNRLTELRNNQLEEAHEELEAQNRELLSNNEEIASQRDYIDEQSERIRNQHKEIFNSIEYAKRIQEAMIPKRDPIKDFVSKCILIFKPKEIISGDFKWSVCIGNKVIIAAADCTGHGVPGAFLSMLGISLLNEIVGHEKITDASDILNQLRKKVIESLSQNQNRIETKDGMDINLCVYDFQYNTVEVSGAYNSLILIRNGELTEFTTDRMPIGIHDNADIPFRSQRISFKKGDRFFQYTDGFQDQFGGPTNKKIMKSRFKQLLLETAKHSLHTQKEMLNEYFEDWKGKNEQVDDVLVIGIEI